MICWVCSECWFSFQCMYEIEWLALCIQVPCSGVTTYYNMIVHVNRETRRSGPNLALLETQAATLVEEVSSACAKVNNLGAAIAILL